MNKDYYTCLKHETRVPLGEPCVECLHEPKVAAQPADSIGAMLDERGKRYGKFVTHALIAQRLKSVVGQEVKARQDKPLDPDQAEALDMICHKLARIVNGDPDYADNWVDIAGYAKLVADRLQGVER